MISSDLRCLITDDVIKTAQNKVNLEKHREFKEEEYFSVQLYKDSWLWRQVLRKAEIVKYFMNEALSEWDGVAEY